MMQSEVKLTQLEMLQTVHCRILSKGPVGSCSPLATECERKREYALIVPKHTCDLGCLYTSLFPILSYNPHQTPLKLYTHILLIHLGALYRAESPVLPKVKVQDEGSSQRVVSTVAEGMSRCFCFFSFILSWKGFRSLLAF